MTQTKLANLVNPEVMADMISAGVKSKLKFSPLARLDETLVGQAGDTVTVPRYEYIGDAEDLTEGVAMGTTVLTTSSQSVTVKQAGKAVEITDKAALAGYGDPVGEAEKQLETSIAQKVDKDCVSALATATLTHDASASLISYGSIVSAIDKFEEEDDEQKILFIHPLQKGQIRNDAQFTENVPNAFMTGVIGEIAGCQVVASNKVPFDATTYSNLIVKPGALAIYLKRDVLVESQRDILAKTTVISADEHYAAALEDESKVVKLVTKKA